MATRSTIAVEFPSGRIRQTYCHWDGYLDHNGKILLEHYSDVKKARQLVHLGQISSLRKEIGEKHDFDARYDNTDPRKQWTTFYGRDRGEEGQKYYNYKSFEDYVAKHQYEEYEYILRNTGEWQVSCGGNYQSLADAIAAEMLDNEMAADE